MSQRVPKIAETPLELFAYNPDIIEPYINKFWGPGLCATMALLSQASTNYFRKRPISSGIMTYALLGTAGAAIGYYFDQRQKAYHAEYDAVVRHYITLHPDDFPPFQRQKYSELFEEWCPVR